MYFRLKAKETLKIWENGCINFKDFKKNWIKKTKIKPSEKFGIEKKLNLLIMWTNCFTMNWMKKEKII